MSNYKPQRLTLWDNLYHRQVEDAGGISGVLFSSGGAEQKLVAFELTTPLSCKQADTNAGPMVMNFAGFPLWPALPILLLLGAGISAWQLLLAEHHLKYSPKIIRESEMAHFLMNISMGFMFTPWYRPPMRIIFIMLYGGIVLSGAILFAVEKINNNAKSDPAYRVKLGTYLYHIAAGLIMLFSLYLMQSPGEMSAMPSHGLSAPPMVMQQTSSLLARIIAGGFFLDALTTSVAFLFFPRLVSKVTFLVNAPFSGAPGNTAAAKTMPVLSGRAVLAAGPHVIMDIGMVFMLLTM